MNNKMTGLLSFFAMISLVASAQAAGTGQAKPVAKPKTTIEVKDVTGKTGKTGESKDEGKDLKDLAAGKQGTKNESAEATLERITSRATVDTASVNTVRNELKTKEHVRKALAELDKATSENLKNNRLDKDSEALTSELVELIASGASKEIVDAFASVSGDAMKNGYAGKLNEVIRQAKELARTGISLKDAIEKKLVELTQAKSLEDLINCKKG
jgi:hypothetical protein